MTELSISEIVQMGVQIEKNGREFYAAAAEAAAGAKAREVLLFLAGEEEKHEKVFGEILSSIERYEPGEAYPEEYFAYMNVLAREHVFTREKKGREMAALIRDDLDALKMATGFEKDSILFYHEMKKAVGGRGAEVLDRLIEEERRHLRKLSELRAVLSAG